MHPSDPASYQPQLTWWGHTWRFVAMLAVSGVVCVDLWHDRVDERHVLLVADIVLGVTAFVLVCFRRRWPVTVAVLTTLIGVVSGLSAGPALLAAVSLATRRVWWQIIVVGILAVVSGQLFTVVQPSGNPDPALLTLSLNIVVVIAMMAWGMYVGSRRELLWTLRSRAERAETEQELRVAQARGNERARIAREMHDVLAHRISQISMHAGALSFREDLTAQEMRSSAAVIQDQAHEALIDLRGVLGVLRDDGTGELLSTPQPTYDDLPGLVAQAEANGLKVTFTDRLGDDAVVPDAVGRTLFRIVQEGITNARKHAPGAVLSIEVSGTPDDGIDVTLRNPVGFGATAAATPTATAAATTPGAGLGLVGLAERAALRGGRLQHRRDGSVFVLQAWIPWTA